MHNAYSQGGTARGFVSTPLQRLCFDCCVPRTFDYSFVPFTERTELPHCIHYTLVFGHACSGYELMLVTTAEVLSRYQHAYVTHSMESGVLSCALE